ncbi:MAG: hypothetical protein R6V47_00340, partial [Candidatus Delongbacteria bacterium]
KNAVRNNNVVVPVPSEIIMALDVLSDTDWKAIVEYNYTASYSQNYKIALNLGVRVAQGFIAIQAKDRRNTGEMFLISRDLAENFGAKSEMFVSREQITKLINEGKWVELREILDDIHLRVKEEMSKYDRDFVTLAGIGGWLEGLNIVTKALNHNYSEDASTILYQPELIQYFIEEMDGLKNQNSDNLEVKAIKAKLPEIKKLCVTNPGEPVSEKNVKRLNDVAGTLNKIIVSPPDAEEKISEKNTTGWVIVYAVILIIIIIAYVSRKKKGGN